MQTFIFVLLTFVDGSVAESGPTYLDCTKEDRTIRSVHIKQVEVNETQFVELKLTCEDGDEMYRNEKRVELEYEGEVFVVSLFSNDDYNLQEIPLPELLWQPVRKSVLETRYLCKTWYKTRTLKTMT